MAKSVYAFASPAEAVAALMDVVSPVDAEHRPLELCDGRVLAEDIFTDRPSPACDVSAMDGFALRVADAMSGSLPIGAEARIGAPPVVLPPGAAARIVTGAPTPDGADAVVKREDVRESSGRIEIPADVATRLKPGASMRRRGENAPGGRRVLSAGSIIGPAPMGVLASVGAVSPRVYRPVRVGILVTGDELLPIDSAPEAWQLRDSNGPALACLFGSLPFVEIVSRRHAADDPDATAAAIGELASGVDVLFITGGVSMGHRDYVPGALKDLGARVLFHRLPQRPGKPILAAVSSSGVPVLALPGNPVSVLVTARRIGVPVVRRRAGCAPAVENPPHVAMAAEPADALDLWWHRPVTILLSGAASPVRNMGSGDIMATAASDGFIEVPPGRAGEGPWAFYSWRA